MFYGLPNKGKIIVKENFVEIIKDQIPNDWEYVMNMLFKMILNVDLNEKFYFYNKI